MKICVVGLGYIGLPTAAMFATHGQQVVGVDKNPKVLEALSRGEIIIEEKDLDKLVKQAVSDGSLCGSEVPVEADAFIIAVPTPITAAKTLRKYDAELNPQRAPISSTDSEVSANNSSACCTETFCLYSIGVQFVTCLKTAKNRDWLKPHNEASSDTFIFSV